MNQAPEKCKTISIIAAMDQRGLIGRNGDLPWRLPNDLKHFKQITMGKTMLMGRRTWDSLGRALPGRQSWVVTRQPDFAAEGARIFGSVNAALTAHDSGELMVIGGAELYRQILPRADNLYLTQVLTRLAGPEPDDVFFPEFDASEFLETSRIEHSADERHAFDYHFVSLERR